METYPFPTQVPTTTHEFKHGGNCEIVAIVEPDDFGPKIEVHSNVTVEGGEETKQEEEAREKREAEEKKETEAKEKREAEEKQETEAKEKREAEEKQETEAREKREAEEKQEVEAREKRETEEKKEAEAKEKREAEEKKEKEEGKKNEEAKKQREAEEKKETEAREKREAQEKQETEAKEKREAEEKQETEAREKREAEEKQEAEAKEKREAEEKQRSRSKRGVPISAEFSYTSPAMVSQPAKFAAKVTDPNNKASPHAQYKYVWEFGDGVTAEGSGGRELRAEHAYVIEGRYEVKLEVTDEAGRTTVQTHMVQVNALPALASIATLGGAWRQRQGGGGRQRQPTTGCHEPACARRHAGRDVAGREHFRRGDAEAGVPGRGDELLRHGDAADPGSHAATAHGKKRVLTLATGSFTVVGGRIDGGDPASVGRGARAAGPLARAAGADDAAGARSRRVRPHDAGDRDAAPREAVAEARTLITGGRQRVGAM